MNQGQRETIKLMRAKILRYLYLGHDGEYWITSLAESYKYIPLVKSEVDYLVDNDFIAEHFPGFYRLTEKGKS